MSSSRRPVRLWLFALLLSLRAGILWGREDAVFRFVQISDTHWGSMDSVAVTRALVSQITNLPVRIDFVAHTGDVFADCIDNPAVVKAGLASMAELTMPVHYVPGNHDLAVARITNAVAFYTQSFGPINHVADYHGVRCVFWGSAYAEGQPAADDEEAMAWLERQLHEADGMPVLVFHHFPAVRDLYDGLLHNGWSEARFARWERILQEGGVRAVFAGHAHSPDAYWVGNVPVYLGTPVIRYFERQPSFRVYEYRNGRLSYSTQFLPAKKKGGPLPRTGNHE